MRTIEISEDTYRGLESLAQAQGIGVEESLELIVRDAQAQRESTVIARLQASGFFINEPRHTDQLPSTDLRPVDLQPGGKPVSQILIEERR